MKIGNKWLVICIGLIIVGLVLGGCAKPTPPPTPTPTPAPTPTPTPAPARPIVRIEIRTAPFGGTSYILGFALADILNKKHPWIRASAVETLGSHDNFKVVANDPAKKARTIFQSMDAVAEQAGAELPPFTDAPGKYKGWKVMSGEQSMAECFMTLDPTIKSIYDFVGKKLGSFHESDTKGFNTIRYLKAAGVYGKVEYLVLGWGCVDALIDGKVDVAYTTFMNPVGDKWGNVPAVEAVMGKKKIYVIPIEEKILRSCTEMFSPVAGTAGVMPANSIKPGFPEKDILLHYFKLGWLAYPELPDEVVYEVVKTIDLHYTLFPEYHAAGARIIPENLGAYPFPKEYWHPGARKYLDEKGYGYGMEYLTKLLQKK